MKKILLPLLAATLAASMLNPSRAGTLLPDASATPAITECFTPLYDSDFNPFDAPKPQQKLAETFKVGDTDNNTKPANRQRLNKILGYVKKGFAVNAKGEIYANPHPDHTMVKGKILAVISPTEFEIEGGRVTRLKAFPKAKLGDTINVDCVRGPDADSGRRTYIEVEKLESPSRDQLVAAMKNGQVLRFTAVEFRPGAGSQKQMASAVTYTVTW